VSLHTFIKGRASHPALDRSISMAKFIQARVRATSLARGLRGRGVAQSHLRISIWAEFFKSDDNWADGISRLLEEDPFCKELGVVPQRLEAGHPPIAPRKGASARGRSAAPCGRAPRSTRGTGRKTVCREWMEKGRSALLPSLPSPQAQRLARIVNISVCRAQGGAQNRRDALQRTALGKGELMRE
jgi:hypothetical protein